MRDKLTKILPLAVLCGALGVGGAAIGQEKAGGGKEPAAEDAPDEIVVLGRINQLRTEVQRSEEAFYDRFNEINGDPKFDIHCRMEPLINSHIPRRVCASNAWHDVDAKIGSAALREFRGELGSSPDSLVTEQTYAQKELTDAMRRATAEDPQLQQDIVHFVAAKRALEEQMHGQPRRSAGDPYVFIECVPTIYPVKGVPSAVVPGETIEYKIPDMYGRPWAQIWEEYFEQGMDRPKP